MKHPDYQSVNYVMNLLRVHGIESRKVPEGRKKSCDIVAWYRDQHFYIEVKERSDPKVPGRFVVRKGWRSSLHKQIEGAAKQLLSMPDRRGIYRIVWMVIAAADDDQFLTTGVIHTLYGIQRVSLRRGDWKYETDCLFYRHSPFRKWPSLDLAVIQTKLGLIFCLNPHSIHYGKIKRSRIFKLPKRLDGVVEPILAEKNGCCIIAEKGTDEMERGRRTLRKYGCDSLTCIGEELVMDSRTIRF